MRTLRDGKFIWAGRFRVCGMGSGMVLGCFGCLECVRCWVQGADFAV